VAGKLRRSGGGGDDACFLRTCTRRDGIQAAGTRRKMARLQTGGVGFGCTAVTVLCGAPAKKFPAQGRGHQSPGDSRAP